MIKPKEETIDDRFIGKHFRIKYNNKDNQYYLKDLGHGFGTFVKINKYIEIKDNFLISIGVNYIVITLGQDEDNILKENITKDNMKENDENKLINLKLFSSNINHGILTFDKNKEKIVIGRCSDCDVIIEDTMLSRFHCTIFFKNDRWFICDGFIENNYNKKSTNGTWLYAFENTIIKNGMIFKSNHNLFICSFE